MEKKSPINVITESVKEPVVGLWQRIKSPIEAYGLGGFFIAIIAISLYYFTLRLIITTVNSNTDRVLKEVGLGNTPKLLHNTYLLARLDEDGDIIPVKTNGIEVPTPETVRLVLPGIYLVSYHYSSPLVEGAYVELDSDEIAQSCKPNDKNTITGSEVFITSEPDEEITFNLLGTTPRNGSGKFKIIYLGNI